MTSSTSSSTASVHTRQHERSWLTFANAWVFLVALAAVQPRAAAQPEAHFITESHKNVGMEVGETRLMSLSMPIIRVSVADPNVADVQVVTPEQVLITAKSVGFTLPTR